MFDESSQDAAFAEGLDEGYPWIYRQYPSELNQLRWLYDRATQQYVVVNLPGSIPSESVLYGQTPTPVTGDILVVSLLTNNGHAITVSADGMLTVADGGDTAYQTFSWNIYDSSLSAFYDVLQTGYINYPAPTPTTSPVVVVVERNQSITPVDLSGYVTDSLGNTLSYGLTTIPPGSLNANSAGLLAGITPNANSITSESIRVTNIAGDYVDLPFTLIVGAVTIPDVTGLAQIDAQGALTSAYLTPAIGTSVFSASIAVGSVVSENPAQFNEVAAFSTVTLALSLGATGPVTIVDQVTPPTYAQGTGIKTINLAAFFSGASTFSIAESAYLASISGSLVGSILSLPTVTAGTFGPFTVTGANNTDSKTLDPFSYFVSPAPAPPTNLGLTDRPATTLRKFLL